MRSPGGPNDPPRGPLELWVADVATGQAKCLLKAPEHGLHVIFDDYSWLDEHTIVACVVPSTHTEPPAKPTHPLGPKVQARGAGLRVYFFYDFHTSFGMNLWGYLGAGFT